MNENECIRGRENAVGWSKEATQDGKGMSGGRGPWAAYISSDCAMDQRVIGGHRQKLSNDKK